MTQSNGKPLGAYAEILARCEISRVLLLMLLQVRQKRAPADRGSGRRCARSPPPHLRMLTIVVEGGCGFVCTNRVARRGQPELNGSFLASCVVHDKLIPTFVTQLLIFTSVPGQRFSRRHSGSALSMRRRSRSTRGSRWTRRRPSPLSASSSSSSSSPSS